MSTDAFEIEALDQPTFTQVGHWVAFQSDLSPTARHLYTVLATFVNQRRRANGDTEVWPSLNLLAVILGLSKGDSVTPYIDELIQANIVVKTTHDIGGMKARNRYAIRFNPPPGAKVITDFVELLEPHKAIAGNTEDMSKAAKAARALIKERRERESAPRARRKDKASHVPRKTGVRAPENRGTHPGKLGSNKTQGELDGGRTTRTSSSSAEVQDITHEAAPIVEKKTKKSSPEQIIIDKLSAEDAQPQGGPPTPEEATAIKRLVLAEAVTDGVRVRSVEGYLFGRDTVLLEQDLAAVRGHQTPAQASAGGWSWEHQHRAERRHRNGVVGGTRHGVGTQATYDAMAQMSQDELRALMLG